MIGIYKITSPSGKVYIGQSINIERRFKNYKNLECKLQIKLYNSLIKYGVSNHIFEIIEECDIEELNTRERYYQDLYDVLNKGLNCVLTETDILPRIYSDEYRLKLSESKKGKSLSLEHRKKLSISHLNNKHSISTINKSISSRNRVKLTKTWKTNIGISKSKKVIDLSTNIIYDSATAVCDLFNIKRSTLNNYLNNNRKNKTTIKYLID